MWNLRSSVNGLNDRYFCSGHLGAASRYHLLSSIKVVHATTMRFEAPKSLLFLGLPVLRSIYTTKAGILTEICEAKTCIFVCCDEEDSSYR